VLVHYGDQQRIIRAVLSHSNLGVFSDIVVIANDLSQQPESLKNTSCRWLIPKRNIGFGDACQLGATTCPADVYAFFNAHITMDEAAVHDCVSAFDVENVGIVAPYVYHPGTNNAILNWKYAYGNRTYSRILRLPIDIPLKGANVDGGCDSYDLIDNDWATGAPIFCRKEIITDIGWDGSFFLTFEDVDISLRTKKRGWRVVVVPSAIAFHSGESTRTSTASVYYVMRNTVWFARKHHGSRVQVLLTAYLMFRLGRLAMADMLKRRRPPHARPAIRGILDGWFLWPGKSESLPGEPLWPPASLKIRTWALSDGDRHDHPCHRIHSGARRAVAANARWAAGGGGAGRTR